ncbi:MAG: hypothetical protein ACREUT_08485, partial [Steroidobacteraceae bacterium]
MSIFNAWPYRELWKSSSFRGHRRLCRRWNPESSVPAQWSKSWIPDSARDGAGSPGMTIGIVELRRESGRPFYHCMESLVAGRTLLSKMRAGSIRVVLPS